ncbi:MAG: Lrp/AsnC family transcriptional regulator [Bacteroidota bacterium]
MDNITLDRIDLEILRLLQRDAWMSGKQIALALNKGNSTITRKIEKLKATGFLLGSVAIVDHIKISEVLIVFVHLQLTKHNTNALDEFQDTVIPFEEVVECYQMTGTFDFLLKIVVPNMSSYQRFLKEKMAQVPNLGSLQSHFVIHETKRVLGYPIQGRR